MSPWSENGHVRIHKKDLETLLAVDCRKAEVTVNKSLIQHSHVGTRIFTAKQFGL